MLVEMKKRTVFGFFLDLHFGRCYFFNLQFLDGLASDRAMYFYGSRMGICYFAEFVVGQQTNVALFVLRAVFLSTSNLLTWYLYWI